MYSYEKYVRLCNGIGQKPTPVAIASGLQRSQISRWKNGGGISDASAFKIADYFGVPVSELLEEKENPTTFAGDGEDEITKEIFDEIKAMSAEEKQTFLDFVRMFKARKGE